MPTVICGTVTRFYMHACELKTEKVEFTRRGVWGCAYYELVFKKIFVTDLYTASHKTPTNDRT